MQIRPQYFMKEISWDKSYDDPTGSGKVTFPYDDKENFLTLTPDDMKYIYKGVSCKLKVRRSNGDPFSPTGLEETGLNEEEIKSREHIPTLEKSIENGSESLESEEEVESSDEGKEVYSRSSYDDGIYGFVTDVTYNSDGVELEIKDWGYEGEKAVSL